LYQGDGVWGLEAPADDGTQVECAVWIHVQSSSKLKN